MSRPHRAARDATIAAQLASAEADKAAVLASSRKRTHPEPSKIKSVEKITFLSQEKSPVAATTDSKAFEANNDESSSTNFKGNVKRSKKEHSDRQNNLVPKNSSSETKNNAKKKTTKNIKTNSKATDSASEAKRSKKQQNNVLLNYEALLSPHCKDVIKNWIQNDIPLFDIGGLVAGSSKKQAELWMESCGVFAGKPFFDFVFEYVGCDVKWRSNFEEGMFIHVKKGEKKLIATVTGPACGLLQGERTALNILSRCSGVASASADAAKIAKKNNWKGIIAGTRKTTPGFCTVEKYGLLVGGADTHHLDLGQKVILRDNHICAAGSVIDAIELARSATGFSQKIEVECQTFEKAKEAATAGAEIVMLNNFEPTKLRKNAKKIKEMFPHVIIEVSGNITTSSMGDYMSDEVDVISRESLTQGYTCIDYSLKIVE